MAPPRFIDDPDQPVQSGPFDFLTPVVQPEVIDPREAFLMEQAAMDTPTPDDYWARVGRVTGGVPFPTVGRPMRRRPSGIDVIASLLAGVANYKATQGAARSQGAAQAQRTASDAARELAEHRHRERIRKEEAKRAQENIEATRAATAASRESTDAYRKASLGIREKQLTETGQHNDAMERAAFLRTGLGIPGEPGAVGAPAGPGAPKTDAQRWADRIISGQAKFSDVPLAMRNEVNNAAGTILPDKARAALAKINSAQALIDNLDAANDRIDKQRGIGKGRFRAGMKLKAAAIGQSPGVGEDAANYEKYLESILSLTARGLGEVGTLTDVDRATVKRTLPDLFTARGLSKRRINDVRKLFNDVADRTIKTYGSPAGEVMQGSQSPEQRIRIMRNGQSGTILRKDLKEGDQVLE